MQLSLWCHQVDVGASVHQNLGPVGTLADGRDDVIYGRGIVWGQIAPLDIPPMYSLCHMKADNVRTVEENLLQGEVIRLVVEHGDAVAMRNRRLVRHDQVSD